MKCDNAEWQIKVIPFKLPALVTAIELSSIPFGYFEVHSAWIEAPAASKIDLESVPLFKFNDFVVVLTIISAFGLIF